MLRRSKPAFEPPRGWIESDRSGDVWLLTVSGEWDLAGSTALQAGIDALLAQPQAVGSGPVRLDLSRSAKIDTAGAVLLRRLRDRLEQAGYTVTVTGIRAVDRALMDAVWKAPDRAEEPPKDWLPVAALRNLGEHTVTAYRRAKDVLGFFGLICIALVRALLRPGRIRGTALVYHMQHTGLNALPILGLLAFMMGIVIGFQGAEQLSKVGAEMLVTNLLGVAVLREVGSMITAIIVAGRSGSAFTAQIGTMKVNQEIDAMRTIGLDPMEILVVPRLLALMIVMPLLTFFANIVALFGGAVMNYAMFDISIIEFFLQIRGPLDLYDVSLGLWKAPAFALVIAMVGCYEGLQVSGSAESVGLHTTKSVVESIFLIMILNGLFSIVFTALSI